MPFGESGGASEPEQPHEVVGKSPDHDAQEHDEPHLAPAQTLLHRQAPSPPKGLDGQEEEVATVQDGDRKKIEDGEIHAEERHEAQKEVQPLRRRLARGLTDGDDAPHRLGGDVAGDQVPQELDAARRRLRREGRPGEDIQLTIDHMLQNYVQARLGDESAAAVVIDAVLRLLPGVLGDSESAQQDSFFSGLLDCPHYTRPEVVDGMAVPPVLLGGNHEEIRRWRLKQALGRTWLRRPDLLDNLRLTQEQIDLLDEFIAEEGDGDRNGG